MLPRGLTAKLIILIGFPYWPNKKLYQAVKEKISYEHKGKDMFKKSIYNAYYMVRDRQYFKDIKTKYFAEEYPTFQTQMVLVRNEHDAFLDPTKAKELAMKHDWTLIEMPGGHDDLWINPEAYVNLVDSLTPED